MDINWFVILEQVLYVVVTVALGFLIKFLRERGYIEKAKQVQIDDNLKRAASELAVLAVQQLYRDLDGKEKFNHATQYVSGYLSERGIKISDTEIKILLESSIKLAKKQFGSEWEK